MRKSGLEFKVGFFVLICLGILGALMLQFSKGTTFFRPTYTIGVRAPNIGGLRVRASVLMSGVQVGTISGIVLSPEGTNVTIELKIYRPFEIHRNARFAIEQFGFLGDQYVAIYPQGGVSPIMQSGESATADAPFNMQEFTRSATGFILRIDETAKRLNDAINDVRRFVLNEQTLTNLSYTVGSLRQVADDAQATVVNNNQLIVTNSSSVGLAVSNLTLFSAQLKGIAQTGQNILDTNGPVISTAVSNVAVATVTLTNLLHEVQAGHGLVGSLLENQQLAANVSLLSSNLTLTSSNLNEQGLWRLLFGWRKSSTPTYPNPNLPPSPDRKPAGSK